MVTLLKAYRADGTVRAIWRDVLGPNLRHLGFLPQRASRIEVVEEGPHRGKFHVDMTLLAELTANPEFAVCFSQTFDSHTEAVAAEVAFIEKNWMLGNYEKEKPT